MALGEVYARTAVTVGSTAYSVANDSTTAATITTDGLFHLWIDPINLSKGDYFRWYLYEKVLSGSTQRVAMSGSLGNQQSELIVLPPLLLMHGWDFQMQKIAGTDRAFDLSVRANTLTVTEEYSQSALSVSTTELSLTGGTSTIQTRTTEGVYQLWLDAANMAKGDEYEIKIYEKTTSGTQRQVFDVTLHDVQTQLLITPLLHLRNGWDFTAKLVSGTARNLDASIRRVS